MRRLLHVVEVTAGIRRLAVPMREAAAVLVVLVAMLIRGDGRKETVGWKQEAKATITATKMKRSDALMVIVLT